MKNKCAIPACGRTVSDKYLMCYDHWRRVPQDVQNRVWIAYFNRSKAEDGLRRYAIARDAAIEAVTAIEAVAGLVKRG